MPAAEPTPRARVVVLLSGTGSLCAALLAATDDPAYPAEVVAVGADRDATGLAQVGAPALATGMAVAAQAGIAAALAATVTRWRAVG